MQRPFVVAFVLMLALAGASVLTQEASAPLHGRWVVLDGEHTGNPKKGLTGGVMTITGRAFEIRTASGNMLKGTLTLDASKKPAQMDLVHADGAVWEAVYETSGDTFRLNYVEKGEKDPRPASFRTSEKTEESLIVLRREKK